MNIPVNRPWFHGNEKKFLEECITTGWLSSEGPFITKFEEKVAALTGRKHAIAVSSGSAALDVAVAAAGIGPADEVIIPAFTIISPALAVIKAGGQPVLVDSDPLTWNIDVEGIESKITKRTKAILIVHTYGLPVDVDPILILCKKYGLILIEDAAEMQGQTYKGRQCGNLGHISVFSFYPNKVITTGEGGMVLCDDEKIALKCRRLRNLGFEETGRRFIHKELGWNYRMTNMQAAVGLAQLEHLEVHLERKKKIGSIYQCRLSKLKGFQLPLPSTFYAENIYWIFGLVAENELKANKMVEWLNRNGIGTRPFFWCMHEQPIFQEMRLFREERYVEAEKLARNGFYIPSGLGITDAELECVAEKMLEFED